MGLSKILGSRKLLAIIISILVIASISVVYVFGGGYTDKIYLEFSNEFKVYGKGFVNIVVISPNKWVTYKFSIDNVVGKKIEIDVKDIVSDFIDYYKNLTPGYRGPIFVPTISITMFYYNSSQECIASYAYTTRDWFMDQGLDEVEAGKRVWQNPMAMLERRFFLAPVIRFRVKMPTGNLKPVCTDFTPALKEFMNELNKRLGIENTTNNIVVVNMTIPIPEPISRERDSTPSILPTVKAQTIGGCTLYGYRITSYTLYIHRNNPPPGWYANITGIPDNVKYTIWNWYASNFSVAYLWEQTPTCKSENAVYATALFICLSLTRNNVFPLCSGPLGWMWVLTAPGIYDMDQWLSYAATAAQGGIESRADWRDYKDHLGVKSITIWTWVPYLGIRMYNPYGKPIGVYGSIAMAANRKVQRGVAFLGTIVWPQSEEQPLRIRTVPLLCAWDWCEHYAVFWTGIRYVGDVMAIMYDVSEETIGGKKYWVVTPVATVLPAIQTLVDYGSGTNTRSIDSNLLNSFTYQRSYNTVVISRSNVQRGEQIYRDAPPTRGISADLGDKLVQLGANIIWTFTIATVSTIAGNYITLAGFFIRLIGSFFSYVWEDLYNFAVGYALSIDAIDYCPSVTIYVYKWTLRYRAQAYDRIGYVPLLVMYEVYVL
jgi:hypothetical protein